MYKKECRKQVLCALAKMSDDERIREDCKIYDNVVKLEEYKRAETIFAYISVGVEADTRKLVADALSKGKRVAIPRCIGTGIMHAVQILSLSELVPDKYDIPSAPKDNPIVPSYELDMILVPGVAFDRGGRRLGRGGGYYDRYLAKISETVCTVGICHSPQLVEKVVCDVHDKQVNYVVTPDEIIVGER